MFIDQYMFASIFITTIAINNLRAKLIWQNAKKAAAAAHIYALAGGKMKAFASIVFWRKFLEWQWQKFAHAQNWGLSKTKWISVNIEHLRDSNDSFEMS